VEEIATVTGVLVPNASVNGAEFALTLPMPGAL
jgi:hypothetical protein